MIAGTGPGRGVPWWRHRRLLLVLRYFGSKAHHEPEGQPREGTTVYVIRRKS